MSSQTTLTEDAPMILDATCSFKHEGRSPRWPKHATIRIDKRAEVKPDLVMDNTNLKFPDRMFDEIYWDPPHLIRLGTDKYIPKMRDYRRRISHLSPGTFERYGWWETREEWLRNIEGVNLEFYRCLKANGILHVKITDVKRGKGTRVEEVINGLTRFQLIKDIQQRSKHGNSSEIVHWLTMKPKA